MDKDGDGRLEPGPAERHVLRDELGVKTGLGKPRNLTLWAASGAMEYFELADALQDNGWPQDDRGEQDGKHHIECPFWHEHTTLHERADALLDEEGVALRPLDQGVPERPEVVRTAQQRGE